MIVCAAIQVKGTTMDCRKIDTIVCGHRHCNCFDIIKYLNFAHIDTKIQGFINHKGEFLDRKEALAHALECGQLTATHRWYQEDHGIDELYSEDLY